MYWDASFITLHVICMFSIDITQQLIYIVTQDICKNFDFEKEVGIKIKS